MKEKLRHQIREVSFRENQEELFTLASGKKSPFYVDMKQTLMVPRYLDMAGELILDLLDQEGVRHDAIGGMTMGADPLVYSVALKAHSQGRTVLPFVVRKQTKEHGMTRAFEGRMDLEPRFLVLLDDVVTTGGSTIRALDALRQAGVSIDTAVAVVDRDEGGRQALAERGVRLLSLFTVEDLREAD